MNEQLKSETFFGACPHDCPDTCSMIFEVKDRRHVEVRGNKDHPMTRGGLCVKLNHEHHYNPDRLLYPMRRTGPNGSEQFERITWEAAISETGARWREIIARHCSQANGPYATSDHAARMGGFDLPQPTGNDRERIARLRHASRAWSARYTMPRVLVIAITIIGYSWFLASPCTGEPISASPDAATEELKSLHDPTILDSRIWLDSEWNKFEDDSSDWQQTLAGVWAWPISDRQDWGVRLKLPFIMHFAGDAPGDAEKQALGDIQLATGTAFRMSKTWRAGGGLQLRTPSGTNEELSDNTWRLQEFGAVAWDATPWLTFSPSLEHNHSVAEQSGTAPQHFLELFFPATFLLASQWSLTAQYETKIDFENDAWIHSGKLALATRLEELPLAFSLAFKKPFEGDKEFQVNFVSTYYFSSR